MPNRETVVPQKPVHRLVGKQRAMGFIVKHPVTIAESRCAWTAEVWRTDNQPLRTRCPHSHNRLAWRIHVLDYVVATDYVVERLNLLK